MRGMSLEIKVQLKANLVDLSADLNLQAQPTHSPGGSTYTLS